MRKKLLSLFVVFCMLLGMVPAVFANDVTDALGISEEDVAMYVSEDTTLSENVEGLVLVTAPVKVTVDGAKLATGLVLAPDAEGATVTITDAADVNAVVVLADATVIVEETAAVANIDVSAAGVDLEVAGTVGNITVEEDAAGAQVVVAQSATVSTLDISAAGATVDVAGSVATVEVKAAAAEAKVTVEQTAKVTSVAVAAANVSVDVAGTVETVSVAQTAASASVSVAQTATVSSVAVSGSNAKVDVAGTVKSVEVKAAATGSSVNVEKSANVSKVEVAASDVTVGVAGTVGSVDVAKSANNATLVVEEDAVIEEVNDANGGLATEGPGAENIEVTDKSTPTTDEGNDDDDDGAPVQNEQQQQQQQTTTTSRTPATIEDKAGNTVNIKSAPLANWEGGEEPEEFMPTKPSIDVYEDLKDESKRLTENVNEYDVVLSGSVTSHQGNPGGDYYDENGAEIDTGDNSAAMNKQWVGIAIPKDQGYVLFLIDIENNTVTPLKPDDTWIVDEGEEYDTYYFNGANAADYDYYTIGVVKVTVTENEEWEDAVEDAQEVLQKAATKAALEALEAALEDAVGAENIDEDFEEILDEEDNILGEWDDTKDTNGNPTNSLEDALKEALGYEEEPQQDPNAESQEALNEFIEDFIEDNLGSIFDAALEGFDFILHLEYKDEGTGDYVDENGEVDPDGGESQVGGAGGELNGGEVDE